MHGNGAVIEHQLRRLDGDDLAALVADLWAARGYETEREGVDVVASHGEATVRIRVPGADETPGLRDRRADVVVAVDGQGHDKAGTRRIDAARLVELLEYGVDSAVRRELCDRHLGAPPGELPLPPLVRLRRGLGGALDRSVPEAVVGVVAVVVMVGVVAGLVALPIQPDSGATDAAAVSGAATPVALSEDGETQADRSAPDTTAGPDGFPSRPETPPPGVSNGRLVDVAALAAAHERAMANRSHTVWLDYYWPRNLNPNRTQKQRDIDMAVAADGRYLIETTDVDLEDESETPLGAVYSGGTVPYAAAWDETNGSYGRVFRIDPRRDLSPTPETVRTSVVERYLSASNATVTDRINRSGSTVYTVVVDQPNVTAVGDVSNYSAVAKVDARGFLRDLAVTYEDSAGRQTYDVRREVTYGRLNSTTVNPPSWYLNREESDTADDGTGG